MTAPVLILAVGNESRGDDALGPLLLRELTAWLREEDRSGQFELLEEFQLQVENAMDMKDRQLVLLIDAGMGTQSPFSFYRAQANNAPILYSHELEPEALLNVYGQFYQEPPPKVYILCICGERFELGEGLSPEAAERLSLAFELGKKLLLQPDGKYWDSFSQCVN